MLRPLRPARATVTCLAAVALAAVPAAGASAKALPDLQVTTKAPATTVAPGKKVTVTVTLRNEGRARAGATTTRISVGTGSTYAKGDQVLATLRQKPVGKGSRTVAKVTLKVPASAAATAAKKGAKGKAKARTIVACADSGRRVKESAEGDNCTRVARVDAKAAGTVDGQAAATKAKPKVPDPIYAPTTPPAKTRDRDPSRDCDVGPGTQVPQDLANWDSLLSGTAQTRFWWPKSRASMKSDAQDLAAALDGKIYPKLTGLMKRVPLSDDQTVCPHGSDGHLDVYLVDIIDKPWDEGTPGELGGTMGSTIPFRCRKHEPTASSIVLARRDKETLAHEFFHVMQFAYGFEVGCVLPGWIAEGTAEWAVEHVYPHTLGNKSSSGWLEAYKPALTERDYSAWPFWYDAVKRDADHEQVIPRLFTALGSQQPLAAADTALGRFATAWPRFARDAYNITPVDTFATDDWTVTTKHPTTIDWLPLGDHPIVGSRAIAPLARGYDRWLIDDGVRRITIAKLPAPSPDYRLRALVLLANGQWQEYDVDDKRTWCRDNPGEDVTELVLISSNASVSQPITSEATITGDAQCAPSTHYKVLSASFENHTTGSMFGQYCPVVGGVEDYGGQLAAPVSDPDFTLTREPDGDLDAGLFFDVSLSGIKDYTGCKTSNKEPCSMLGLPFNPYSNTTQMGVRLGVDHVLPAKAQLEWFVHEASIGVIDSGDDNCNVFEFRNQVPLEQRRIDIPRDDLMKGTHTYTVSHNTTWDTDAHTGHPATLKMNWTYTITIQVVDADGNPIV